MSVNHDQLPDGRLKRTEQWIDRHARGLLRIAFVVMFAASLTAGLLAYDATQQNKARLDQSCTSDEREHKDNVDQLARTYLALESPTTRAELGPGLVRLIVVQLPMLERKARSDQAPEFCDEPGVGLPEPDPKPPERRDFNFLLVPSNSTPSG